jgi:hypothetical protein
MRLQSQNGMVGRSASFNGKPTHPSTHPVYRGVLTRSVKLVERGQPVPLSGMYNVYNQRVARP